MADPRFTLVDALAEEDTSEHNRINEVREAATFDVLGLVDEMVGGVIGYLHVEYADAICNTLNALPDDNIASQD